MSLNDVKTINDYGKAGNLDAALVHMRNSLSGNEKHDVFLFSAAIKMCGEKGNWRQALTLLDEMEHCGIAPNLVCCNTAITACVNNKQSKIALNVVWQLVQRGVRLDNYTCSTTLKAYGHLKDWQGALSFLDMMPKMLGVMPNAYCYSAAINACEKGGQWRKAVEVLDLMRENKIEPTTVVCTSVVSACKAHGQWEAALRVLDQMDEMGVKPDAHTFSNAISACDKAGKWNEAIKTFERMKKYGVGPTLVCYGAVLSACEKGKQWGLSMEILDSMTMKPDHIIYTTVLGTCNKTNRWAEAISVLDRMTKDKGKVDKRAYDLVIGVCNRANRYQEAITIAERAMNHGIDVDQRVQEELATLAAKEKDKETALDIIDRMENEGYPVQAKSCNIVGKVCEAEGDRKNAMQMWKLSGNWRKALTILQDIEENENADGEEAFYCDSALHACGKGGAWQEALMILEKMASYNIKPNRSSLGVVAQACKDAGEGEQADRLLQQIKAREIHSTVYSS